MVTAKQAAERSVAAFGLALGLGMARRWQLRWGATDAEVASDLPGDDLLPRADLSCTRAITIDAPVVDVWPWIAQMGQGRGGLYSYDFLENLIGCDMRSAVRVVDEWQDVAVGDPFRLHPDVALEVVVVDPSRALVVRGGVPMGDTAPPYDFTWAFVLTELADGTSRLAVRERYAYTQRWALVLVELVEVVSFVMSRQMLRGIRRRAQQGRITGWPEAPTTPGAYLP